MRLILVLIGYHPSIHPPRIGEFEWSQEHQAYVWQGRELTAAEFNEVADRVLQRNRDLWDHPVTVRVIEAADSPAKDRAPAAHRREERPVANAA